MEEEGRSRSGVDAVLMYKVSPPQKKKNLLQKLTNEIADYF